MKRDSNPCGITNICDLPTGQILVADLCNNKVKLLNQLYPVVSHWDLAAHTQIMCQMTPRELAVTLNDYNNDTHAVQFISNSQLVNGRNLQLQHGCIDIAQQ
ncbi:hypothetical protein DPMN_183567 [Dreissena polymorpha]|uniref:Uncharacterized protein n=1 Tax=Dreissena polymorpha TaxID=45954 RepID=A0A9D4DJ77_DREPO|nr:hypothetical protein DPMN_183567 [Dreissena polymorpha]